MRRTRSTRSILPLCIAGGLAVAPLHAASSASAQNAPATQDQPAQVQPTQDQPALAAQEQPTRGVVMVFDAAIPAAAALRVEHNVLSALAQSQGAQLPDDQQSALQTRAERTAAAEAAIAELKAGEDAFLILDIEPAVQKLEHGIAALSAHLDAVDEAKGRAALGKALTVLGGIKTQLGERDAALAAFTHAIALDPSFQLPADQFGEAEQGLFSEVLDGAMFSPRASLKIPETSAPALVWLDGRQVGTAPLVVDDLLEGPHHVVLKAPGGRLISRSVQVKAGETTAFDVAWPAAPARASREARAAAAGQAPAESAPDVFVIRASKAADDAPGLVLDAAFAGASADDHVRITLADGADNQTALGPLTALYARGPAVAEAEPLDPNVLLGVGVGAATLVTAGVVTAVVLSIPGGGDAQNARAGAANRARQLTVLGF